MFLVFVVSTFRQFAISRFVFSCIQVRERYGFFEPYASISIVNLVPATQRGTTMRLRTKRTITVAWIVLGTAVFAVTLPSEHFWAAFAPVAGGILIEYIKTIR